MIAQSRAVKGLSDYKGDLFSHTPNPQNFPQKKKKKKNQFVH